jgi:hypothetical protein
MFHVCKDLRKVAADNDDAGSVKVRGQYCRTMQDYVQSKQWNKGL